MLKIFGKEFTGKYFDNWTAKDGLRLNLIHRVRRNPYIYASDLPARCADALDEDAMELLKLQKHLKDVITEKKDAIRQAQYALSDTEEALRFVDDAVNTLLIKQAWSDGYAGAEEDLKPKKKAKSARADLLTLKEA